MDKQDLKSKDFHYVVFQSELLNVGSKALFSDSFNADREAHRLYDSLKKTRGTEKMIPMSEFLVGVRKIEYVKSMKFV